MLTYAIAYAATAVIFLAVDLVWLGWIAKDFYRARIGHLMADDINVGAAVGFYLFYVVGLIIFAVAPALQAGSWKTALTMGALFGLFTYATYDMTNLSTLRGWPVAVAALDIAWGAILAGGSATAGYFLTRQLT